MRSAALAALVLLAGCQQQVPAETSASAEPRATAAAPAPQPSTSAASPAPVPKAAAKSLNLRAFGTEPFWSIEIMPGKLRYTTPESPDSSAFAATSKPQGKGVRYSGTFAGKPISLLIEPGPCSDGMSDTVHKWIATLQIAGRTEHGCARAD